MAELVLVAKSTYVWLAQLSRAVRPRRSGASTRCPTRSSTSSRARASPGSGSSASGSAAAPRAASSSCAATPMRWPRPTRSPDYRIADELGGETAWRDLRDRAAARGIRLAADMVPNHMGIDSSWVVEHPERFIACHVSAVRGLRLRRARTSRRTSARRPPASRTTTGTRPTPRSSFRADRPGDRRDALHLSRQRRHELPVERHRAARLPPAPRCARPSSGQILDVARRFPVIRFDAAMVLAKRHIQRLWYPAARARGGAIPSRGAAALPARGVRTPHAAASSGARSSTGSPPRRPTRCCWPRRSGCSRATSSARWACTASTTAPSCTCCATRRTPSTSRSSARRSSSTRASSVATSTS